MKHRTRSTAAALAALLSVSLTVPAFAETASSEKEEVIYIMTDAACAAYECLCTAAAAALNTQLEANDMEPVSLTPSAYIDLICVGECTSTSNFLS
mgnify:CR=1 FL=1